MKVLLLLLVMSMPLLGFGQAKGKFFNSDLEVVWLLPRPIPSWTLVDTLTWDLNKDGQPDKMQVYAQEDLESKRESRRMFAGTGRYAVYFLLRSGNGYELADSTTRLDYLLNLADHSQVDIRLENGYLMVQSGDYGSRGGITYRDQFRFQQGKMRLIGHSETLEENGSPESTEITAWNLSTGKLSHAYEGREDFWLCPVKKPLPGFADLKKFEWPDFAVIMQKPPLPKKAKVGKAKPKAK